MKILWLGGYSAHIVFKDSERYGFADFEAFFFKFDTGVGAPEVLPGVGVPDTENQLTPVQIAEGIQQRMLLDIGDIESIVATPSGSHAILTARLKDGSSCSYILTCNEDDGTTSLLANSN